MIDVRPQLGFRRFLVAALIMTLALALTACPRPLTPPMGLPGDGSVIQAADHVEGRISFGFRHMQAGIKEDVAPGATVSLIELTSGNTVSTTRTDADGKFVLTYSNGFKPKSGDLYYFEAAKGLSGGTGAPNAVGADAVRVRTIASYRNGGWVTLTSGNAGTSILISPMTTALSVVVSLRQATSKKIDPTTLFGAIKAGRPSGGYPDTLQLSTPQLVQLVQRAYDLVVGSLEKDRDPLRWIQLSSADPEFNTVTLPELPFSITYLDPPSAVALENIDLVGSNFEGLPVVDFQTDGGQLVRASVVSVSPDLTRITVTVPPTAVTGHVQLTIGNRTLNGPIFRLETRDGHTVVDAQGNLYAANRDLGTVAILEPVAGSDLAGVRTLVTGLGQPSALTFGLSDFTSLYVASVGRTVWKASLDVVPGLPVAFSTKTSYATGAASDPGGMAFRNKPGDPSHGTLYITDSTANQLYVVPPGGGVAQPVTVAGLNQPKGLSFGPDGRLYVANAGANNVLAITLTSDTAGTAAEFASGFSMPWGIAFDNRGNCYVSNHRGNSVYRVPLTSEPGVEPFEYGDVEAFSSIPTPAGLDADASGYLYVADRLTNGIYTVNSLAESRQVGFGMNTPTSTWVDGDGLFMLTDSGRLLHSNKLDSSGVLKVVAQGLLTAKGLARDSEGSFYTLQSNLKAITKIRPDGSTHQVVTQLDYSGNVGLSILGDRLYVRQTVSMDDEANLLPYQGEVLEYTLTRDGGGNLTGAAALTRRLRSPVDKLVGIGFNNGNPKRYYTVNPRSKTLFEVTLGPGSSHGIFTPLRVDSRLTDPRDVFVDSAGKIWVADYAGGPGGVGGLYVYNADGTDAADYSVRVNRPTNLAFDGTHMYVNSHLAAGSLTGLNITDGTVARTIPNLNQPRGFAFTGDTLFVNEWGISSGRIVRLDNYKTLDTPLQVVTTSLKVNDFEASNGPTDPLVYSTGSDLKRILYDGSGWFKDSVIYRDYTRTVLGLTRTTTPAGNILVVTEAGRLFENTTHLGGGLYGEFNRSGYAGIHGDATGWGLATADAVYSYGLGNGFSSMVTETFLDGSMHRSYLIGDGGAGGNLAGMVSDGAGTIYLTRVNKGEIYRIQGGKLESFNNPGFSTGDRMYGGISYYNGKIYQAIYNKHWIDQIDVATKARTSLKLGLITPEL